MDCIGSSMMMFGKKQFLGRWRRRRFAGRRRVIAAASILAALVVALWAPVASAILVAAPIRSGSYDHDEEFRISRADCDSTNGFTFTISDIVSGDDLSVWATGTGAACETANARNVDNTCTVVTDIGVVSNTSTEQTLSHSAIAGVMPDVTGCDDASNSDAPRAVTLFFLVNESQGDVPADSYAMVDTLEVDLIGPSAPSAVTVSVNDDTSLLVSFTEPSVTTDVKGYRAYCDPMPGADTAADWHQPTAGAGGVGGAGGMGGVAGGGGATSSGGGVGGGGGTTSSGTGGTTSSGTGGTTSSGTGGSSSSGGSSCSSDVLIAGEIPSSAYECGSVTGTGDITVTGLSQNQEYVIAVAAYDQVHNLGVLSGLGCGSPEEVTDFFDAYTAAGGQAGGGVCQCALVGVALDRPLAVLAVFALGLIFVVRRNRRRGGCS
ncbi:MAG: hypothetical protein JRI68_03795 [Deltaproteobacteria bacterium]|nr:hypothetical protein [Deltaproteobacteria bacterium]